MIQPEIEILAIAIVVAVACALPGVFLVLRRMALMADAISHSILLGIVIGFLVAGDVGSPLLIVGAAATGVLTVLFVEILNQTRLVKEDAAIGLVFPVLFSIGVILIARHAGSVHLDTDAVLLGELVFAPFERLELAGRDMGPRVLWVMLVILALNAGFLRLFYKELKLTTFDAGLATALGFSPIALHYLFMSLVSITAVGAFDAVGSILVVAMMIGPPAAAYLLTDRLPAMIGLSAAIGAVGAIGGYFLSSWLDASIAGSMSVAIGICFEVAYADLIRDAVRAGGELLVIPTNNSSFGYTQESSQQLAMSVFRAVEHGRATVQISTVGISGMIAPNGVIIDSGGLFTADQFVANLPLRTSLTPATRLGHWPTLAAGALALLALVAGITGRGRREEPIDERQGRTR